MRLLSRRTFALLLAILAMTFAVAPTSSAHNSRTWHIAGMEITIDFDDLQGWCDELYNYFQWVWSQGPPPIIDAPPVDPPPVEEPSEPTPPVTEPTPPVDEPTPPTAEPTPPVVEPTPPVTEPTPPVTEPTPPVTEPTPPTAEPTPPVVEPTPPVTEPRPVPGFDLIFSDDFTKDASLGSMGSDTDPAKVVYTGAGDTKWFTYPKSYLDTYKKRPYRSDAVLSVHDGNMDFWLHNVDGQPAGANPSPVIKGDSGQYQTFGRYTARLRVDGDDLSEYHVAWLLWPENGDDWASAESDFPEDNLRAGRFGVHGFSHYGSGLQESFGDDSIDMHEWHTYTQEWTPLARRYFVDDKLIYTTLNPVWSGPQRWQLQTETIGDGDNSGHLLVDWVKVYSWSGG
jgi:hypothetical protein